MTRARRIEPDEGASSTNLLDVIAARMPAPSSMSALRSAGTNRPSSVSTAMPMSTCGCSVRVRL
jgi:hypothetical protein